MTILHDYQRQAVAAFWAELSPDVNRVAIEMATGLGKTITFAGVIDEWLTRCRDQDQAGGALVKGFGFGRVLVLADRDELIRQAVDKIQVVTRGRWSIGVVKAGEDETDTDIVVASVQTLIQPGRMDPIGDVGLIVVDECDLAAAPTYEKILRHFGGLPIHKYDEGPHVPVLGVTATLARNDGQGLGRIWQTLAFSRGLSWAIRKGHLIDLVPYTIKIPDVNAGASDAELDATLAEGIAPEAVVTAWAESAMHLCDECKDSMDVVSQGAGHPVIPGYCPNDWCSLDMPSSVLFAPLVKSARAFADAFNHAGVKAEVVHGAMPDAERRAVLERYEAGITTVICNAMALTRGWDSPRTMCVIVARPTKSVPLFVQMVGRGLRKWLGAEAPPLEDQRCILLCVQGTTTELATVADLSENVGEVRDGVSLMEMEDQWDLGADIESEAVLYRGPVRVEQWDSYVQRSSKAWNYTTGGVPYLPTEKRGQGYVFAVEAGGAWQVWARHLDRRQEQGRPYRVARLAMAPDLELAMALAEDEAQELGGDLGALLADKARAWRKAVPSAEMQAQAQRLGLGRELIQIMESKSAGKAGRLSDLISRTEASRILDVTAEKIAARNVTPS